MCPHPGDVLISDEFSTCVMDFHCPGEQICCKNQEDYSHCVFPIGTEINNSTFKDIENNSSIDNLAQVCKAYASSWSSELVLTNYNCTESNPGTCPASTLCCYDKCFGANIEDEDTFNPPLFHCHGKLYCHQSNSCHTSWNDFSDNCTSLLTSSKGSFLNYVDQFLEGFFF